MKNVDVSALLDAGPTREAVQAAGFPMGGETLAVDLADTLVTVTQPATDLLVDQAASDRFWSLHAGQLPDGWTFPPVADTRRLRNALRAVLDAAQQHAPFDPSALRIVNVAASSAPTSPQLDLRAENVERREHWHVETAEDLALAAAARSTIDVLTIPELRAGLRRCASPTCSMLYVRGDARRRWCTPNICSNRDRVARHYRRRRHDSK